METFQERFEVKFEKGSGCWNWKASKDRGGYGQFRIAVKMQRAHRVAYQLYVGEIPDGLCCLHRCDNRLCVRPDHLFLGTQADNVHDCENKSRGIHPTGEKHYCAKLTEEQVKTIRARWLDGARGVDLAIEFGVSQPTISMITTYRVWKHIKGVEAYV